MITVPEGALVLFVGVAGSGKSELAQRLFRPSEVVSSDVLRLALTDDETDQSENGAVFHIISRIVSVRLRRGHTTVVDATNLLPSARRPLLALALRHGRPALAIVLDYPAATVAARLAMRMRQVTPQVLERHELQLRSALSELSREGVTVARITDPDALVTVVRTSAC